MADVISKGTLFPEELIPELIQQTVGASALAKLCAAKPIPFNGQKEFTFTLDKEIDVVAENGAKTKGGATYRCYFTSAIAITSDAVCKKIGSKGKDPVKKNRQKNAEGCNALLKAAGRC